MTKKFDIKTIDEVVKDIYSSHKVYGFVEKDLFRGTFHPKSDYTVEMIREDFKPDELFISKYHYPNWENDVPNEFKKLINDYEKQHCRNEFEDRDINYSEDILDERIYEYGVNNLEEFFYVETTLIFADGEKNSNVWSQEVVKTDGLL